ncbi:MAG: hypothetical protein ACOYYS_21765, partial [Chloroflexota bacterium]
LATLGGTALFGKGIQASFGKVFGLEMAGNVAGDMAMNVVAGQPAFQGFDNPWQWGMNLATSGFAAHVRVRGYQAEQVIAARLKTVSGVPVEGRNLDSLSLMKERMAGTRETGTPIRDRLAARNRSMNTTTIADASQGGHHVTLSADALRARGLTDAQVAEFQQFGHMMGGAGPVDDVLSPGILNDLSPIEQDFLKRNPKYAEKLLRPENRSLLSRLAENRNTRVETGKEYALRYQSYLQNWFRRGGSLDDLTDLMEWRPNWREFIYKYANEIEAYDAACQSRPTILSTNDIYWGQHLVNPFSIDPMGRNPFSGRTIDEGAQMIKNGEAHLLPLAVFEKQPWMEEFMPLKYKGWKDIYTGDWATTTDFRIYTLNNRGYTAQFKAEQPFTKVYWPRWIDVYFQYSHQFKLLEQGKQVKVMPDGYFLPKTPRP